MKIVVDAMGGDFAPVAIVEGVVEAINKYDVSICLVGQEERINEELKKYKFDPTKIEIVHAPEVVDMHDPAITPVRKKKNSSISLGIQLLNKPGYDAFVSAGNTGAVVAASTIYLGMLEGVERPAIGLVIPTLKRFGFLMDVGATPDPKAHQLLQWALLADVYIKAVLGYDNPTVGLLNIGEEEGKGGGFEKEAFKLMQENLPNFTGNVEAREVFTGKSDCIICNGFVGNVTIKVAEGLMESMGALMKREIKKDPIAILGALIMKKRLEHIKKFADYSEYGGAPLLGVKGLVMISHGRSSPKAIRNAIRATMKEVDHDVIEKMRKEIARDLKK